MYCVAQATQVYSEIHFFNRNMGIDGEPNIKH